MRAPPQRRRVDFPGWRFEATVRRAGADQPRASAFVACRARRVRARTTARAHRAAARAPASATQAGVHRRRRPADLQLSLVEVAQLEQARTQPLEPAVHRSRAPCPARQPVHPLGAALTCAVWCTARSRRPNVQHQIQHDRDGHGMPCRRCATSRPARSPSCEPIANPPTRAQPHERICAPPCHAWPRIPSQLITGPRFMPCLVAGLAPHALSHALLHTLCGTRAAGSSQLST